MQGRNNIRIPFQAARTVCVQTKPKAQIRGYGSTGFFRGECILQKFKFNTIGFPFFHAPVVGRSEQIVREFFSEVYAHEMPHFMILEFYDTIAIISNQCGSIVKNDLKGFQKAPVTKSVPDLVPLNDELTVGGIMVGVDGWIMVGLESIGRLSTLNSGFEYFNCFTNF